MARSGKPGKPRESLGREWIARATERAEAGLARDGVDVTRLRRWGFESAARDASVLARHDRRYSLELPFGGIVSSWESFDPDWRDATGPAQYRTPARASGRRAPGGLPLAGHGALDVQADDGFPYKPWRYEAPAAESGAFGFPGSPALGEGLVFVPGLDGRLYAFTR